MKLEKRASFGWPATNAGTAPCRNGLVAHYDGDNQGLAGKSHTACRTYWKNTRKFHMGPSRGWLDIGYSFGVCPHGVVFEGRGFGHVQAAQPGGNTTWTSCTFMSGPSEKPTTAQLTAWAELRAYLRGKGLASAVKGHRDFLSTTCPGGILYGLVKDGSLKKPLTKQEDDMPFSEAQLRKIVREEAEKVMTADAVPAPGSNPADGFDPDGNPGFDPAKNPTWGRDSVRKQTIQGLVVVDQKLDALTEAVAALAAKVDAV